MPHDKPFVKGDTYAHKIDGYGAAWLRNITPMRFCGTVATKADLPSEPDVGDIWNALDTNMNWIWTGDSWDPFSGEYEEQLVDNSIHAPMSIAVAEAIVPTKHEYHPESDTFTFTNYIPDADHVVQPTDINITLPTATEDIDGLMSTEQVDELTDLREDLTADEEKLDWCFDDSTLTQAEDHVDVVFSRVNGGYDTITFDKVTTDTAGVLSGDQYSELLTSYNDASYDPITNKLTLTSIDGDSLELYLEPTPVDLSGSYVDSDRKLKIKLIDDRGADVGSELVYQLPEAIADVSYADGKLTFSYIDGATPKEVSLGDGVASLSYNPATNKMVVTKTDGTTYDLYLEPTPVSISQSRTRTASELYFDVNLIDDQNAVISTVRLDLPVLNNPGDNSGVWSKTDYADVCTVFNDVEYLADDHKLRFTEWKTGDTKDVDIPNDVKNVEFIPTDNKLIITYDDDTEEELSLNPEFPPVLISTWNDTTRRLEIILKAADGTEMSRTIQTLPDVVKNVTYADGIFTVKYLTAPDSTIDVKNFINGLTYDKTTNKIKYTMASGGVGDIEIPKASLTQDGILSKEDYKTFSESSAGSIVGANGIKATTAGTTTTVEHTNSVTAQGTSKLRKITYDAQGHVTGSADADAVDTLTWDTTTRKLTVGHTDSADSVLDIGGIATVTGDKGIKATTAGTATTVEHTNSVTAQGTSKLRKITYDAQGHVTGSTDADAVDSLTWDATTRKITVGHTDSADGELDIGGIATVTGDKGITATTSGSKVTVSHANNITADGTKKLRSFAYDANGHVTTAADVVVIEDLEWDNDNRELTSTFTDGTTETFTISGGGSGGGIESLSGSNGISASVSGTTGIIKHTNNVTADTSGTIGYVKYDAQGHITGVVDASDDIVTGVSTDDNSLIVDYLDGSESTYDLGIMSVIGTYGVTASTSDGVATVKAAPDGLTTKVVSNKIESEYPKELKLTSTDTNYTTTNYIYDIDNDYPRTTLPVRLGKGLVLDTSTTPATIKLGTKTVSGGPGADCKTVLYGTSFVVAGYGGNFSLGGSRSPQYLNDNSFTLGTIPGLPGSGTMRAGCMAHALFHFDAPYASVDPVSAPCQLWIDGNTLKMNPVNFAREYDKLAAGGYSRDVTFSECTVLWYSISGTVEDFGLYS